MQNLIHARIATLPLLFVAACTERPADGRYGPAELDHSGLRPVQLEERVLTSGDYLAAPGDIALVGEHLLVIDGISDSVLHVIDAQSGQRLRSLGRRGEGPGEFRGAWSIARPADTGGRPWVYDLQLARLTEVDVAADTPPSSEPRMIRIQGEALATQPVWVNDSTLVSPNFSPGGRLSFFGADGTFRRDAGEVPRGDGGVPPAVMQHAWTGTPVSNPRTGALALATRHADQVEIYRPDGTRIRTVRGPFRFDPEFTVGNAQGQPVMASDDAMRFGYIDAEPTAGRIYTLFSGRTREGYKGASSFGRYVHVYDWDGELKEAYRVDSDIVAITVSPEGERMYGIRHDPEPAVVAYDLP